MSQDSEKKSTMSARLLAALVIGILGVAGLLLYKILTHEDDRPTIRVRNGSVDITVDAGDFQPSGNEWYSDAPGREPTQFEVTLTGTSCDGTTTTTQPVVNVTYKLAKAPHFESFSIHLKNTGTGNQAFITPVSGAAAKGGRGRLRLRGQGWALYEVAVNGRTCTMTQDEPKIDIDQVP